MTEYDDLLRRVVEIERRLGIDPTPAATSAPSPTVSIDRATELIDLTVVNKRYQAQNFNLDIYQDALWFDCVLVLHPSAQPTRAVKGVLEFCDIFGEVCFALTYTLTEPLHPGRPWTAAGVGFEFNQFMSEHNWMLGTELHDMVTRFRVSQVMYADGSSETI